MLNFIICDDNQIILDKLEKILNDIFSKNGFEAKIAFKSTNVDDHSKVNNKRICADGPVFNAEDIEL